jgi:hypothetical protein
MAAKGDRPDETPAGLTLTFAGRTIALKPHTGRTLYDKNAPRPARPKRLINVAKQLWKG